MSNIASPNQLNMLDDASLTKYAAAQKAAGNMANFSLAFQISNDRSRMRQQAAAQAMGGVKPPVADSDLQQMAVNANQVPNMPTGMPQAGAGSIEQTPEIQNAARGGMLPENQGIGTLPAKNLEKFADGGITGQRYADKGAVESSNPDYQKMIIANAIANHIDPKTALAIAGAEGRIKNPKSSATGFYQITDDSWQRYGGNPDKRNDPAEQIRVGTKMLADNTQQLAKTLGRAPTPSEVYATHFLGGPTGTALLQADPSKKMSDFLKEVTPSKANKIISSNPEVLGKNGEKTVGDVRDWSQKTIAKKLTDLIPIGSAQAGTLPDRTPAPVATPPAPLQSGDSGLSNLIPGQGPNANTSVGGAPITGNQGVIGAGETALQYGTGLLAIPTAGTAALYQHLVNGAPLEQTFSNLANQVTYSPRTEGGKAVSQAFGQKLEDLKIPPYLAHLGLGETLRAPETSVEGTAQAMQDAIARGQRKADLPRLEAPAKAGEPIVVDSSGNAMTASRRTNMQNALNDEAGIPANAGEVADWQKANATAKQLEANKEISAENRGEANRAQATATALGVAPQNTPLPGAADTTAPAPVDYDKLWGPGATVGDVNNYTGPNNAPSTSDIGKNVTDTSGKGGRDWNDFLLNLGLGLMAGKSPYALQNLGEAGIGALRQEQEAKKQALQERQAASLEALQKQQGAYATAQAGYLESLKGPQAALELAEKLYDAWSKSPAGVQMTVNDPAKANQMYKEFVQGSYKDLGIIHPNMMSPETAALMSKYGVQ